MVKNYLIGEGYVCLGNTIFIYIYLFDCKYLPKKIDIVSVDTQYGVGVHNLIIFQFFN